MTDAATVLTQDVTEFAPIAPGAWTTIGAPMESTQDDTTWQLYADLDLTISWTYEGSFVIRALIDDTTAFVFHHVYHPERRAVIDYLPSDPPQWDDDGDLVVEAIEADVPEQQSGAYRFHGAALFRLAPGSSVVLQLYRDESLTVQPHRAEIVLHQLETKS